MKAITDDNQKRAKLLNLLNESASSLLIDLLIPDATEQKDFKILARKLDQHFKTSFSLFAERTLLLWINTRSSRKRKRVGGARTKWR